MPFPRPPSRSSSRVTSELTLYPQPELQRFESLAGYLAEIPAAAFLIVGSSATEPDLAAFLAPAHLGRCFIVGGEGLTPHLGYFTEMERDEAAATGLPLLDPETLGLAELRRGFVDSGSLGAEVWLRALESLGAQPGMLAIGGRLPAGELIQALPRLEGRGWTPVGANEQILAARRRKTLWERDEMRRAAEGTCATFRRVAAILAAATACQGELVWRGEVLTAGRLRGEIAVVLAAHRLGQPEGNIVSAGSDAAVPHTQGSSDRVLRPGESIVVDLYPKGYLFADCTRTFCRPPVPAALARAHREVLRALETAEASAEAGVGGGFLQNLVCSSFEEAGFETVRTCPGLKVGYVHSVGHGVGFDLHEMPAFRDRCTATEVLAEGDAITLEPGLYDPEQGWGVRLENLYLIEQELENLTPLPYALDPHDWEGLE